MTLPIRTPDPVYLLRVLLALDRLANAFTGGDDRETVSERLRNSQSWLALMLRHFAHDEDERRPR